MPILTDLSDPSEWVEPDDVPRPVVTYGTDGLDVSALDADGPGQLEKDFHRHRKAQLMMLLRGVLTCELEGSLWIVPPLSALWVPGDVLHKITAAGTMEVYVAFIDPAVASHLPSKCCAMVTTSLLRELVARSARFPLLYPEEGFEARLAALMLDELATVPMGALHLPMPDDARLRKIVEAIIKDPADRGTMQTWAQRVGTSERTLARLLTQQTGMSFGRWRQQLHLMLAVKWLSTGTSVQQVADDLGYESAGSFVTMFGKALGMPPGRYIAERLGTGK